jgi:CheY-like chemotaxis protein
MALSIPSSRQAPPPLLQGLRILVVEDEQDSRELLDELLRYEGAEVETAADAASGFEALVRFEPEVLLSDIGLPGEDGYSLIRRCRGLPNQGQVPAIAVTAFCRPQDQARSLAAGFNDHVCKPLDVGDLVQRILRLTGREG